MLGNQSTCRLPAEARRQTILQAALHLFSAKGYKGTTTKELASAVGVSEPVLYEHFRTKQELYEAMLDRMGDTAVGQLNELVERHGSDGDRRGLLIGVAKATLEWFRQEPEFVRVVIFSALEGEEAGRELQRRVRSRLRSAIEDLFREVEDPEIAAHAFLCMIAHDGLMQVLFDRPPVEDGRAIEKMVDIFLDGIQQ